MTALREAAQQALEVLENPWAVGPEGVANAITALRAALAGPVQEPVAYSVGRTLHWHEGRGVNDAQLYAAPPQRKPEPVALDWLHKWANQDDGEPETQWHGGYEAARRVVQIHLTAPPQRLPLTEEEIAELARQEQFLLVCDGLDELTEIARAVERAHGIT